MTQKLRQSLLQILPKAVSWVRECEADILEKGYPLSKAGVEIARRVGVARPDRIRISLVSELPQPTERELYEATVTTGLLGADMIGITMGYGIYICESAQSARLFSHEFRHVHQYEQAGSIEAFLQNYLVGIADYGYLNSPLEIDARNHEE